MKLALDYSPLAAFLAAYYFGGIYVATGVLIVAVSVLTTVQWVRHRKVSSVSLISAVLVLIFGGLTIVLHDKTFIQLKFTVLNWLLAAGLLASHFFGEQPFTQRMLGAQFIADRAVWLKLSHAWILFLLALGGLNLYVAYNYPEGFWITFKFVSLGVEFAYMFATILWLSTKAQPVEGQ